MDLGSGNPSPIDNNSEAERLRALHALDILDTPRQECFDRITELCIRLFDCEFAAITLVDEDRQWFLSCKGIEASEAPRAISLCPHVVDTGQMLLVTDAREDDRFSASPLVSGGPRIRSYLGVPIADRDGCMLGTLCIADRRPRRFAEKEAPLLVSLARTVEDLFEAHRQRVEAAGLSEHLSERTGLLEQSNRIFRQAEKTAKIGSWELEVASGKLSYSDEASLLLGYPKGETHGLDAALERYLPEDRPRVEKAYSEIISEGGSSAIEAHVITPDGRKKRMKVVGEFLEGNADHPARIVGIIQDVSEAYHARLALQRAADFDALTGLYNRNAFDRLLAEAIRKYRKTEEDFFVLLLDLDGFKDINDTFGHLVGDVVLEEVSSRISAAVPSGATAARWGGDEFAVITPLGMSLEDATRIGETLIAAVADQVEISGRQVGVSATCGVARTGPSVVARELVRRADLALYNGKAREPGRVHHYDVGLERSNRQKQKAIGRVRNALREDRLFVGYQPIVELATRAPIGFEALMRLNTRSGEMLTATQVLPAILDPILSREISERMVELLCGEFHEIRAAQPGARFVSINATEADLLSRDFAERLLRSLGTHRIPPENVTLEITETMLLVNDGATVQAVLTKLRRAGMRIALDDFGTGFSSLTHLRDFPIDKVKIDGSFVQTMCREHQSRLIVQALIAMATNLGIEVIAEGIETEEQRDLLIGMGCHYGQGFLFSPAETACRLKFLGSETLGRAGRTREAA